MLLEPVPVGGLARVLDRGDGVPLLGEEAQVVPLAAMLNAGLSINSCIRGRRNSQIPASFWASRKIPASFFLHPFGLGPGGRGGGGVPRSGTIKLTENALKIKSLRKLENSQIPASF